MYTTIAKKTMISGFSLIELLIVIVIIGILSAFAYPSYRDYIYRSNRSDAYIAIQRVSLSQERFYVLQNEYTDNINFLGGDDSDNSFYTLQAVTGIWSGVDCAAASSDTDSTNEYTIFATPVAGSVQADDTDCSCIYFNSRGVKGSTGTRNDDEDCW